MLYLDDIKVEFESQGFKGTHIGISPTDKSVLFLRAQGQRRQSDTLIVAVPMDKMVSGGERK